MFFYIGAKKLKLFHGVHSASRKDYHCLAVYSNIAGLLITTTYNRLHYLRNNLLGNFLLIFGIVDINK